METPTKAERQLMAWRTDRFEQVGFTPQLAEILALSDADYHVAEDLKDAGCPLPLILKIVAE